jgi:type II secretory pathway pseudopilin PulG
MKMYRLVVRLRSRAGEQEGFTLIEVMVAFAILMIALLALARTATVAFTDVAASRQRQTANQLANQLVEEVRGIPYGSVERGLKTNQLTGDTNVVNCAGTYYFPVCPPAAGAEKLVHTNGGPNVRPLVPHRGTVGPPEFPTTFSWSVYVTEAADAPSAGAYRITARVGWAQAQRGGVRNSIDASTLMYAPTGSVDESTHPFVGPKQAYFFGTSNAGAGTMTVSGSIPGLTFDRMTADLLQTSATVQTEQTVRSEGITYLPGLSQSVAGVESNAAGQSDAAQADTDPVTVPGTYDSKNVGPQPFGSLSLSAVDRTLIGWVDGLDQGETTAATAAGGSSACNSQSDGYACAFGSVIQPDGGSEAPGDEVWDSSLMLTSPNWGMVEFLRVGSITQPSTAYARRTGAGPAGIVRANATWVLPEIRVAGVPTFMDPPHNNWRGYWVRLTGFSITAQAEAGPAAATPTFSLSGTIEYWRNNNYTSQSITSSASTLSMTQISIVDPNVGPNNDRVELDITGTVTRERTTTSRAQQAGNTTEAKVDIGSPLVAELNYRLERNNQAVPEVDVTVSFHAGRGRVSTSYNPV